MDVTDPRTRRGDADLSSRCILASMRLTVPRSSNVGFPSVHPIVPMTGSSPHAWAAPQLALSNVASADASAIVTAQINNIAQVKPRPVRLPAPIRIVAVYGNS